MGNLVINSELLETYRVTLSKKFQDVYVATPPIEWPKVATLIESGSSRNDYSWLGEVSPMRKWVGPRVLDQLSAYKYSIENEPYEKTMAVKRTEIEDDAGGLFPLLGARAATLARAVAQQPDRMVMIDTLAKGEEIPCFDGQPYFDTEHPVAQGSTQTYSNLLGTGTDPAWYLLDTSQPLRPVIYQSRKQAEFVGLFDLSAPNVFYNSEFVFGADSRVAAGFSLPWLCVKSTKPLNEANFIEASDLMASYTNDAGTKLGISPDLLVVSKKNEWVARKLFNVDYLANGASNPLRGAIEIFVSRLL